MRLIYKIILTIMVMIETSNIFKSGLDIYKNVFIGNRPLFLICTSFIAQLSNKEYNDNNSGSDVEYSKNYNYSVHKKKRNIKDINFVFPYSEQINIYTQKLMIFAINNKECLKTADKDLPIKFDEYKNINIIGIYKRIRVELRSKEKVSLYINNMSEIRPKSDLYPIVVDELSSEDNGLGENSTIYRDLSETRFRPNYKLPINILNEFDNYMNSGGNKIIFFIYDGIWYIYEGNNYYSPLRIGSNMEHLGIFLYTNITQSIHYILVKEITREKSIIDNLGYDRKRKLNKNNYDNEYNILNNLLFEFISRRSLLNYLEKEQDELNDMYSRQIVILREKIESDLRHENISRLKQNNIPVNCNDCTDVFKCPNCNIEIFPTQSDIEFNSVYYLQQKGFWLEDTIINPNYDLFNTTFIDRTDKNINMNENKNRIHKNSTISESDMSNISDYVENNKDKEKMKTVNDKPINKIDSLSYENSASLGSRFENGNDLELDLNLGLKERLDGMLQEESIPESKKSYKSVLSRERSTKIRPYREEYIDMKLSGEIESSIEGSMKIKPSKKGPGKVNPSREEFREAESSRDGSKKVKPSRERYRETESSRDESRK
ncbi:hypothetical protein FG379_002434, partial [Cryptosporidium bovis]|uniref:uncharacterized protein n=1 Tax=Cryptosporidium bovis TaxID=310047 RepID=UPI00351A679B